MWYSTQLSADLVILVKIPPFAWVSLESLLGSFPHGRMDYLS